MEFFKYRNTTKPEKGKILVSEPYLPDPNFERTIILLCEHTKDGSFGFVLNKPSKAQISDVIQELEHIDAPVFVGGPVQQDSIHFLHQCPDLEDAIEVLPGIFWGGNFESLLVKLDTKQIAPPEIKFFVGYSGWGEGQLEEELEADSWIVSNNATRELIFETSAEEMWKKALQTMGGRFSVYSNYPVDPNLN